MQDLYAVDLLARHRAWLKDPYCNSQVKFPDSMEELDFSGGDLRNANFNWCTFYEVCFNNANLAGANFNSAKLIGCSFKGANLEGATFKAASLVTPLYLDYPIAIIQTNKATVTIQPDFTFYGFEKIDTKDFADGNLGISELCALEDHIRCIAVDIINEHQIAIIKAEELAKQYGLKNVKSKDADAEIDLLTGKRICLEEEKEK